MIGLRTLFLISICLSGPVQLSASALSRPPSSGVAARDLAPRLPLLFEENRGQAPPEVRYLARGGNYVLWLGADGPTWVLPGVASRDGASAAAAARVHMRLLNRNPEALPAPDQAPATPRISYFRGRDSAGWTTAVPAYRSIRYRDVYPGIDLVFYGTGRSIEYDFVVAGAADPDVIRLTFRGAESLRVSVEGHLVLATPTGDLRHLAPKLYQNLDGRRREIGGRYRTGAEGEVSFAIDSYDSSQPLTIDPVLVFSTYFGGSSGERPEGVAVDADGNFYIVGSTGSQDFPLRNPFQDEFAGGGAVAGDLYVTKLDPSGSTVIYSTYIGGEGTDSAAGIAVDSEGRAIVTGTTFSDDFPFTAGSFQTACSGMCPFVVRLSPDGTQLSYATFVGRGNGSGVAVDATGQAVITGDTTSADFPVANAFQPVRGGQRDAFVSKLNAAGTALVFSTFLGGAGDENLTGQVDIATDSDGNIYVTGRTRSDDFPLQGAAQSSFGGDEDAFVTKLTPAGALVYSTYIGGSDRDQGQGIDVDSEGNAYVVGHTLSEDFPVVAAFQGVFGGGAGIGDAFVTKLAPGGDALVFSTYLGGPSGDSANDVSVDDQDRAVVVGGASPNFPLKNALEGIDGTDNFVAKFAQDGSELIYSTPVRGGDPEIVVVTSGSDAFVAGNISAGNFTVLEAFQPRTNGSREAFMLLISDNGTLYFAQFANGTNIVSDLLLTNSSSVSTSNATVVFRQDDGSPFPVNVTIVGDDGVPVELQQVSEIDVEVLPLGLVRITTDGVGDVIAGSATVNFDIPLGGVVRFTINPLGTTGVGASRLVRGFITPAKRTNIETGVAIFNPLDSQVSLTLRLRNRAGEEIPGGLRVMVLEAHEHLANFINELFPNADLTDFEGTLTVVATSLNALITATALELGGLPGEFTTLPVTPLP